MIDLQKLAEERPALTCLPPPPQAPRPFGDLVPLGFLLRALGAHSGLHEFLQSKRQDALWSYESDGLVTCIDSCLVLQGCPDRPGVEALERFGDGSGSYYPQLWTESSERGKMKRDDLNFLWCQPDYVTTCLVRALRRETGLPERTPLRILEEGFDNRAGLFFANPCLVDWAVAWALDGDPQAEPLRSRLRAEVLAAQNEDGSFGSFDPGLSTAAAACALAHLGCPPDALERAQNFLASPGVPGVAFHSVLASGWNTLSARAMMGLLFQDGRKQLVEWDGRGYSITYYEDTHHMILGSLGRMAHNLSGRATAQPALPERHPRYECMHATQYVSEWAIKPYLQLC